MALLEHNTLLLLVIMSTSSCKKCMATVGFAPSLRSKAVTVCSGEQLAVTCNTNGSVLSWTIIVPHFSEGTNKAIFETDPDNVTEVVLLGGIPFQFTKTLNSSLMSTVVVSGANVTSDLSGTMVNCTGVNGGLITTTILVVGNAYPVIAIEDQFGIENVTVVLELTEEAHTAYNITTFPYVPLLYINETVVQLTVPYNTFHYVSVVATLCGHKMTNITELYYVNCGFPSYPPAPLDSAVIIATDYVAPALVGSNITVIVSCPQDVDKNSSVTVTITCANDGLWMPVNFQEMDCNVVECEVPSVGSDIILHYSSTIEGSLLRFGCGDGFVTNEILTAVCNKSGYWFPDPAKHICSTLGATTWSQSGVTVLVICMTFLLFACFVTGFICGCLGHKYKKSLKIVWKTRQSNEGRPFPSEVSVSHDLEMIENVAYGQVQS